MYRDLPLADGGYVLPLVPQRETEFPVRIGGGGLVAFGLLFQVQPQVLFGGRRVAAEGKEALGRAVRDRAPILIEAQVGPMPSPWSLMRLQARPGAANAGPPNPLGEPPH